MKRLRPDDIVVGPPLVPPVYSILFLETGKQMDPQDTLVWEPSRWKTLRHAKTVYSAFRAAELKGPEYLARAVAYYAKENPDPATCPIEFQHIDYATVCIETIGNCQVLGPLQVLLIKSSE